MQLNLECLLYWFGVPDKSGCSGILRDPHWLLGQNILMGHISRKNHSGIMGNWFLGLLGDLKVVFAHIWQGSMGDVMQNFI